MDLFNVRKPGDVMPAHSGGGSHRTRRAPGESSGSKRKASTGGAGSSRGAKRSRGAPAAPTTYENVVDAEHGTQWLVVLRKNGFLEVSDSLVASPIRFLNCWDGRYGLFP
jgi:hypothetical protein